MNEKDLEKEELETEKPDFSLDIDDDEIELSMDEDIFEGSEKEDDEEEDLLTEDELESLIIGIDEENDILDIPDEEEVLEELKFLDENFLEEDEEEEDDDEEKVVEKKKKSKMDFSKLSNTDMKYYLMKNRFKLIGGAAAGVFLVVFLFVLLKKDKAYVENTGKVEQVVAAKEETLPLAELNDETVKELTNLEQLAYYRKKAKDYVEEGKEKKDIEEVENNIKVLEGKVEAEERAKRDMYLKSLVGDYKEELTTLKFAMSKSTNDTLVLGFAAVDKDFYDDLYIAIEKAFWKNRDIKYINVSVFRVEDQLKKTHELNVARHEFDSVRKLDESSKDKLERLKLIER